MPRSPRRLTKSRFKLGTECPRKLYYEMHPDIYADQMQEDPFLEALAEGGHQVGALAQLTVGGGTLVETLAYEQAVAESEALLAAENVVIYEPAIRWGDHFIRIDVLEKTGNDVRLIEVKAKSCDRTTSFVDKNGFVVKKWAPYLDDVAYQTWVLRQAHPEWRVTPSLMMIDKQAVADVEGLHQLFRIVRDGRNRVAVHLTDAARARDLGRSILRNVEVDDIVEGIIKGTARDAKKWDLEDSAPMADRAERLAGLRRTGAPGPAMVGTRCKTCRYRADAAALARGLKSGLDQCWAETFGDAYQPDVPDITQIWNFRKTDSQINNGIWRMADVPDADLDAMQQTQVALTLDGERPEWISDTVGPTLAKWERPLHFLDFETIAPAIPFHAGTRPYQTLAFQFSCHHLQPDGTITHHEYIAREPGAFPSYEFLRELRAVLGEDGGTILRYSPHENTVLRSLRRQLLDGSPALPTDMDGKDYAAWIDTITNGTGNEAQHEGARSMVDMYPLVKNDYYHRRMKGKKSIKATLDGVMSTSPILKTLYEKPLTFGTNLKGMTLHVVDPLTGEARDPYTLLPPMFDDLDLEQIEFYDIDDKLKDGGAAMTAYARMQFTEMGPEEREAVTAALLRYCEMDTLAMVMIFQHWRAMTG